MMEEQIRTLLERDYHSVVGRSHPDTRHIDEAFAIGMHQGGLAVIDALVQSGVLPAAVGLRAHAAVHAWKPTPMPKTSETPQ